MMPPTFSPLDREDLVDAHLAHVQVSPLFQPNCFGIEVEGAFVFAGIEFVPADVAGRHAR